MNFIKICGLTRKEDIAAVNCSLPDFIGFVFAPGKRQITKEKACELKSLLSPHIKSVGVFVNAPMNEVVDICKAGIIDYIQLHGDESSSYAQEIKQKTSLPVIKAFRIQNREDILNSEAFPCDYLLLDTYVKGIYGGSGTQFNWDMIPPLHKPYFLAGGIDFENIIHAIKKQPYCLDISSSVETDLKKDPVKINHMIQIIRSRS